MKTANKPLLLGGALSGAAALLHVAIIIGGPRWYRTFGAGEELASKAEQGSWYPVALTSGIALILFVWALYAFSGAGLLRRLPLLRVGLVVITAIYLVRGLALVPAVVAKPERVDGLLIWSSVVCLVGGSSYAAGTAQVWKKLSAK